MEKTPCIQAGLRGEGLLGEGLLGEAASYTETLRLRCAGAGRGQVMRVHSHRAITPEIRREYRIGLPTQGRWREALNTDSAIYGGSNVGNLGAIIAERRPMHGFSASAALTLPPLAAIFLEFDPTEA